MKRIGMLMALVFASVFIGASVTLAAPITLSLSDQNPDTSWGPMHSTQIWAKKIEEATQGKVKIQIYPNQTLAKGNKNWTAVKDGIADMSWNSMTFYTGLAPLSEVISLPGLPFKSAEKGSEVLWKLYSTFPQVKKELEDNHILIFYTSDVFMLQTSKKQVKTLEDMKGMQIRTVGGPIVDAMKALGASPIALSMPDCYIAMQKGTIDGMMSVWEAIPGFRLYEVAKYVTTNVPFCAAPFSVAINKKKWASLPKDVQDAVTGLSGMEGSKFFGRGYFDSAVAEVPQIAKEKGYELNLYALPEKERQRWIDVGVKPVWEAWIKKMESKGYTDARKVLEFVQKEGAQ